MTLKEMKNLVDTLLQDTDENTEIGFHVVFENPQDEESTQDWFSLECITLTVNDVFDWYHPSLSLQFAKEETQKMMYTALSDYCEKYEK